MNRAKISITWQHLSFPFLSLRGPINVWAIIAPNLPLIQYAVAWYLVGKDSPGTMNVVVFGPKKTVSSQWTEKKKIPITVHLSLIDVILRRTYCGIWNAIGRSEHISCRRKVWFRFDSEPYGSEFPAKCVAISPDSKLLAVCTSNNIIRFFELQGEGVGLDGHQNNFLIEG